MKAILVEHISLRWLLCKIVGHNWRRLVYRDEYYRVVGHDAICRRCSSQIIEE